MKLIFQESPQGVLGGWSDQKYYLCETEEEYKQKLNEYRKKRKEIEEATDAYADFRRNNWHLDEDVRIVRMPRTVNFDGFVESDGKHLEAIGFCWHESYERSDADWYFIKPGTVKAQNV